MSRSKSGIGTSAPARTLEVRGSGLFVNPSADGGGLEVNGAMRLDWGGVPATPPTNQAVIWLDSDQCLKAKFANGAIRTNHWSER